jgi:hypothetical protein
VILTLYRRTKPNDDVGGSSPAAMWDEAEKPLVHIAEIDVLVILEY